MVHMVYSSSSSSSTVYYVHIIVHVVLARICYILDIFVHFQRKRKQRYLSKILSTLISILNMTYPSHMIESACGSGSGSAHSGSGSSHLIIK